MVLTCVNGTQLTLDVWPNKPTKHFRCTNYKGYIGFICVGASDGNGRHLGFDNWINLACKAHLQRDYEHIHPRADPAGGFYLFMHKGDALAPVLRTSRTELKMMATSTTKFGFTTLDMARNSRVHWGLPAPPSEIRRPINGGIYVIQVQDRNRVFSCVGRYINRDGWGVVCQLRYQRDDEHINIRPEPMDGFALWVKHNVRGNRCLAVIARDEMGRLELWGRLTRLVFKPVSDVTNI